MQKRINEPEKRLLEIPWDKRAIFQKRPNRFLGLCTDPQDGSHIEVHVRDPGRLRELLFPGNEVLIKRASNPARKTKWDLIAARGEDGSWILVNSGFHSQIASSILSRRELSPFGKAIEIRPEIKVGDSRLDFALVLENSETIYIEVKGCTLQKKGVALFPDAPTLRGTRHVNELVRLVEKGKRASVLFLIFCQGVRCFDANRDTDPNFYNALYSAMDKGVEIHPINLEYKDGFIWYKDKVEFCSK